MNIRFKFLTGDINWLQYGAKWISPKLNNGDFDYWLVLELTNMDEACGRDNEGRPRYNVSLSAVSPAQAGQKNLESAFDCCGVERNGVYAEDPIVQVECLHSYGVHAHLWQSDGNNAHKLLKEAKGQACCAEGLFGFYMDGPKNKIGTTGLEAIKGDLDSALVRTVASGSVEGRILGKMYGMI